MHLVTIFDGARKINVELPTGKTLADAIHASGIQISLPCGGQGSCGKCIIHVSGLPLEDITPDEQAFLQNQPAGARLACRTKISADCEVTLPGDGLAVVENTFTDWEGSLVPIYAQGYGAAFDIGTTTVAGQLFGRDSKIPLAALGEMNAQQPYGADVITRLVYCNENSVAPLRDIIRNQLAAMLRQLCLRAGISEDNVRSLVVTGNSIMLYIFSGLEPRPLGVAPFTMSACFGGSADFLLDGFARAPIYIPPCSSAYIGADITCSVLAGDIMRLPGNVLLIDAGTNGEIVLSRQGRLFCCSTAAGPALEGAGISCGTNAVPGAIDSVRLSEGEIICTAIGGFAPAKICGSGLIDAIAVMLEHGVIDSKGALPKSYGGSFTLPQTPVFISQKDIRQVQLAKSAIRAGIDTLLHECQLSCDQLDAVILCGGFGSYLNPHSAERIGLLPAGSAKKCRAIGNAAGNGAGQILQSELHRLRAKDICEQMETVELATNQYFISRFIQAVNF